MALTAVILVQQSKGSDMGASFGSGASGTVFGAKGATSFFFKLTAGLAIAFVIAIVSLVKITNGSDLSNSVISANPAETIQQPAVPVLDSGNSATTENNNSVPVPTTEETNN